MSNLTMRQFRDLVVDNKIINGVSKGVLLSSAGGVLPDSAHREFMQSLETGAEFFKHITTVKVTRPQHELQHLTKAARGMRKPVPGTAQTTGTITPVERTLTPTPGMVVHDVSYDWLADNADERDAGAVLQAFLFDYVRGEMLDLAGNGDGTTASFLDINVGFPGLLAADSNSDVKLYDVTNTTMLGAGGILAKIRDAQTDAQYREGSKFFMSLTEYDQLLDEVGSRATILGDATLTGGGSFRWQNYLAVGVPKWPNDKIMFTPSWNAVFGVWHEIKVHVRDIPEEDLVRYVIRTRFDFNYANGAAAVYGVTN